MIREIVRGARGRAVPDNAAAAGAAAPGADDYKDKLLKLIPAESVGAYVTLDGIMRSIPRTSALNVRVLFWVVFLLLLALTPLYVWRISNVRSRPQIIVSTLSFAVWVAASGGTVERAAPWLLPPLPTIILVLWTLTVPLFFGPKPASA